MRLKDIGKRRMEIIYGKNLTDNEKALFKKYGEYRYRIGVNGLGEVVLTDFRTCQDIAKGNRAVQAKIKELVA